jgi:putative acetyltransferase
LQAPESDQAGMDSMRIRDETPADIPLIYKVHAAAFPAEDEARLVDSLRADGDLVVSVVAEIGDEIVGHVGFSRMQAPFRALGLAPVGVLPEYQERGFGGAIIRAGLERTKVLSWEGVFVLGDPAYYERFGFSCALAAGFSSKYAGAHFMALALNGNTLPQMQGDVAYAAAFDALG